MAAAWSCSPSPARVPPSPASCRWMRRAPPRPRDLAGGYAGRRGILEMQDLARKHQGMDRMGRGRRLGKSGEDQLQLAGISRDVADGEDAALAALAGRRRHRDVMLVEVQAPLCDRPEIH